MSDETDEKKKKTKKRPLEDILEAIADDEEHEAAVAAVEAMSPEELKAQYEARPRAKRADPPAKEARVAVLEPHRRRRLGVSPAWMVAAAAAALVLAGVATTVALRDDVDDPNGASRRVGATSTRRT